MGNFSKSLGREFGKNTGKFISNKLYGDNWSTPYRTTQSVRVTVAQANLKAQEAIANAQIENARIQQEIEEENFERNLKMDLQKIQFSNNKDDIYQLLTEIFSVYEGNESETIKNSAISKIKDGIFKLKSINANFEASYFEDKVKKIENKKRLNIIYLIIFFAVGIIVSIWGWKWLMKEIF
jgi:hypothetical protein